MPDTGKKERNMKNKFDKDEIIFGIIILITDLSI